VRIHKVPFHPFYDLLDYITVQEIISDYAGKQFVRDKKGWIGPCPNKSCIDEHQTALVTYHEPGWVYCSVCHHLSYFHRVIEIMHQDRYEALGKITSVEVAFQIWIDKGLPLPSEYEGILDAFVMASKWSGMEDWKKMQEAKLKHNNNNKEIEG
jgi:hypothetical protein